MPNIGDLSTDNSTTTPLSGTAQYVGTWEDVHHYGVISSAVFADVASAASGFVMEFSPDQTNVVYTISKSVLAGVGNFIRSNIPAQYVRIKYTNGAAAQSSFIIDTVKRYIDVEQVTVSGLVTVSGTSAVSGTVTANQGTNPWLISGNVNVLTNPIQAVSGTVSGIIVSGTVNVPSGNVNILNYPNAQPVSGTVTANQGTNPWLVSGNVNVLTNPVQLVTQGTSPWVVSGMGAEFSGFQGSGAISNAGDTVTHLLYGNSTVIIDASGSFPGGLRIEVSADVVSPNWITFYAVSLNTYQQLFAITSTDQLIGSVAGWGIIRVRAVAGWGVGTANVTIRSSPQVSDSGLIVPVSLPASTFGISDSSGDPQELRRYMVGEPIRSVVYPLVYRGDYQGVWSKPRTPDTFKTVQAAAVGNTALWTPTAGYKFRLMKYMIVVTDNATIAVPGVLTVSLFDGAAGVTSQVHDIYVPAVALLNNGTLYTSPWIELGNGYLSVLANNVLNVNLSVALVTGNVRVIACGTLE